MKLLILPLLLISASFNAGEEASKDSIIERRNFSKRQISGWTQPYYAIPIPNPTRNGQILYYPIGYENANLNLSTINGAHIDTSVAPLPNIPRLVEPPGYKEYRQHADTKIQPNGSRMWNETISSMKCKEYTQLNKLCNTRNLLISGGDIAPPGIYAHVAALGKRAPGEHFIFYCCGTLISHTWVLTVAHCIYGYNGSPTIVRLGVYDLSDYRSGLSMRIKKIVRHPTYKPPAMYADIALVQLEKAVRFDTTIRPACLYQQYDRAPLKVWISGWGTTEYAGVRSDKLRHARLNILDNLSCTIHYKTSMPIPRGISPSMICAGDPDNGWTKDTCEGDSGGPLQTANLKQSCLFEVVGLTSFGEACAQKDSPGVYTRVNHYLEWIEEIVWSEK